MTKINTTNIGDKFESKSLGIIKKVIENEQLGHMSKHLKIFSQKKYYSHQRKSHIKFDLTIEVWPPEASRYLLIYIIECKDYKKRVPVSKIEDFHSKIQQVSGVNAKGIFISNSPLQKGGLNIAESIGMMVIVGESAEDFKIILNKTNRDKKLLRIPFIDKTFNIELIDEGVKLIEKIIDKAILSTLHENTNDSDVSYGIDRLSKIDIEQIAEKELNHINPLVLSDAHPLNVRLLLDYIRDKLEVDIIYEDNESKILGSCDILNTEIFINNSVRDTNRELFILAHELGHFILHQKLSIGQTSYDSFEDSEYNFRTNKYDLKNPKNWIEWQANYFATSLVVPKVPLVAQMLIIQESMNLHKGKIYVDDQIQNIRDFSELITRISTLFNVTKTTVIYKLKELNMIIDKSRIKTIGQIIFENKEEFFID